LKLSPRISLKLPLAYLCFYSQFISHHGDELGVGGLAPLEVDGVAEEFGQCFQGFYGMSIFTFSTCFPIFIGFQVKY